MSNPPNPNERVRIFNQLSETKSVISLAKNIERITNCKIDFLDNPRNEAKKNELEAKNDSLIKLGFEPKLLNDEMLEDLLNFAKICRMLTTYKISNFQLDTIVDIKQC